MTTKITVTDYLAEYCIAKWADNFQGPVTFPDTTELYILIHDLTTKRPADHQTDTGNLEITLPNRRSDGQAIRKNPDIYNYLSERACKNINKRISAMFWSELHALLIENKHRLGIEYIDTVHQFMCKYRIESISEDGLLKNFQRWKENVRQRNNRKKKKICN